MKKSFIILLAILPLFASGCGTSTVVTVHATESSPVEGQSKDFLYNKWAQGIDFYARGNEPFWSLDLDFEKLFHFNVLNSLNLNTPPTEAIQAQDARITRYHAQTESSELIISAIAEPCTDTMSGERFNFTVQVQARNTSDKEYRNFNGCGDYVPDMRLTNVWVIEQVEGVKLQPALFMKGLPTLELSAKERRLNGHDGCNRISGAFSTQKNTISFKQLISTRMACPTPEGTPDIAALLSDKTYIFEFGKNRLYLKKDNKIILTLKHVD